MTGKTGFTAALVEVLLENFDIVSASPRKNHQLEVVFRDGGRFTMNLGRFHEEYAATLRGERQDYLKKLAANVENIPRTHGSDDLADQVVPLVRRDDLRCVTILEQRVLQAQRGPSSEWNAPSALALRPLGNGLGLLLAQNSRSHLTLLSEGVLAGQDRSVAELEGIALSNLRTLTTKAPEEIVPGVFRCAEGDDLEESRLLLWEWVAQAPVADPIVAVPAFYHLYIAAAAQAEDLLKIANVLYEKERRSISRRLYRSSENGVTPFEVEPRHPLRAALDQVERTELADRYAMQMELLERLHDARGEEIVIADCKVAAGNGEAMTFCSWTGDAGAYLPRTDQVFVMGAGEILRVRFEDLEETLAGRLTPISDLFPTRFLTQTLERHHMERLRRVSIPLGPPR